MPKDASERLTECEIQIAHLQRSFDQLNEVVIEQQQQISRLQGLIKRLDTQLTDLNTQPKQPLDPLAEKPPHY